MTVTGESRTLQVRAALENRAITRHTIDAYAARLRVDGAPTIYRTLGVPQRVSIGVGAGTRRPPCVLRVPQAAAIAQ